MEIKTEIVTVGDKRVHRTTTTEDQTTNDLQWQLDELDRTIESTVARYIAPLEEKRAELQGKLSELTR